MHRDLRFTEDIPQLAAEAAELSNRLCGNCRNYHFLWPYLRLVGAPGGADDGKSLLETTIATAIAGGRRKILIAGAADTGLLALVARAAADVKADIVVLDRCATPLELCRRFAARWSLPIETMHADLTDVLPASAFEIVFAHTTLTFVPPERRQEVLRRWRETLRPDGRLILRFRTRGEVDAGQMAKYSDSVAQQLFARMNALQLALPEPQASVRRRIEAYAAERHARELSENSSAETGHMIEAAGFAIETMTQIGSDQAASFKQSTADVARRLFLVVAAPK